MSRKCGTVKSFFESLLFKAIFCRICRPHRNSPEVVSKTGKADLRYGLYRAAFIASTKDKQFMTYFTHKLKDMGQDKRRAVKWQDVAE
jgi:hypothetical protein